LAFPLEGSAAHTTKEAAMDEDAREHDNTNKGALFKNAQKTKDSTPDYRVSITVAGVEHWLSGWGKTSRSGEKTWGCASSRRKAPARTSAATPTTPSISADQP